MPDSFCSPSATGAFARPGVLAVALFLLPVCSDDESPGEGGSSMGASDGEDPADTGTGEGSHAATGDGSDAAGEEAGSSGNDNEAPRCESEHTGRCVVCLWTEDDGEICSVTINRGKCPNGIEPPNSSCPARPVAACVWDDPYDTDYYYLGAETGARKDACEAKMGEWIEF